MKILKSFRLEEELVGLIKSLKNKEVDGLTMILNSVQKLDDNLTSQLPFIAIKEAYDKMEENLSLEQIRRYITSKVANEDKSILDNLTDVQLIAVLYKIYMNDTAKIDSKDSKIIFILELSEINAHDFKMNSYLNKNIGIHDAEKLGIDIFSLKSSEVRADYRVWSSVIANQQIALNKEQVLAINKKFGLFSKHSYEKIEISFSCFRDCFSVVEQDGYATEIFDKDKFIEAYIAQDEREPISEKVKKEKKEKEENLLKEKELSATNKQNRDNAETYMKNIIEEHFEDDEYVQRLIEDGYDEYDLYELYMKDILNSLYYFFGKDEVNENCTKLLPTEEEYKLMDKVKGTLESECREILAFTDMFIVDDYDNARYIRLKSSYFDNVYVEVK